MSDQQYAIELESGQRAIVEADDDAWLREKLSKERGSTRVRVRFDDADVEGHAAAATADVHLIAEDDDTEGHAIAIHFPSREEADAFRKRLLVGGVLAGTIALGAAGGVGLANLSSGDAATAGSATTAGSAWTQDERAGLAGGASLSETQGSAWTQDERANLGAAATSSDPTGSAWTQDERQVAAPETSGGTGADEAEEPAPLRGPTPR